MDADGEALSGIHQGDIMNSSFWKFRVYNTIGVSSVGMALLIPSSVSIFPLGDRVSNPPILEVAQCGGGRTVSPRGPLDPLIPYVINPRDTGLLSDRPDLRWNAVPGGDHYSVSLLNGETVVWTKEVTTHKIEYPTDAPPLQQGVDYTLKIQANNGHSSTEDQWQSQSFHLLPQTEAIAARQAESLLQSPPNNDPTTLLKANLYAGSGLKEEAIATLKTQLETGNHSSTLYRQLGNLYAQSGLFVLAEAQYLKAIELVGSDLEEEAIVQAALGNLYVAMGDDREAVKWLRKAKESYRKLGNQYQVNQIMN